MQKISYTKMIPLLFLATTVSNGLCAMDGDSNLVATAVSSGLFAMKTEHSNKELTAFHSDVEVGTLTEVKSWLAKGVDVNATDDAGWTALHFVAAWGRASIAKLLIANGAKVDVVTESGRTPLHVVGECGEHDRINMDGYAEVAKLFLNKGVDVHAVSYAGKTALDVATLEVKNTIIGHINRLQTLQTLSTLDLGKGQLVPDCIGQVIVDFMMKR